MELGAAERAVGDQRPGRGERTSERRSEQDSATRGETTARRRGQSGGGGDAIVSNEGPRESMRAQRSLTAFADPSRQLATFQRRGHRGILLLKAHSHRVANQTRQPGRKKSGAGSSVPREIMGIRSLHPSPRPPRRPRSPLPLPLSTAGPLSASRRDEDDDDDSEADRAQVAQRPRRAGWILPALVYAETANFCGRRDRGAARGRAR